MGLFLGDSFEGESVTRGRETRRETRTRMTRKDANQPGPAQGFLFVPYLMARCGRQKTVRMNQDFSISASVWPSRAGLAAGDDGAGMAHAAPRRRGASGDEADHRLLAAALGFVLEKLRGVFF